MAGQGKLAVLGSVAALEGRWLKAVEGNARLADWLFQWLTPVRMPPNVTPPFELDVYMFTT